ncbi:MAG TPA: hypothetical protein V6D19_05725 [Stenomitos sp.]
MPYPDNVDSRIAQLQTAVDAAFANNKDAPGELEQLAKLSSIRGTSSTSSGNSGSYFPSDIDEAAGYYGFLTASGAWYIQRVTPTTVRYAAGTEGYTTAWTGRAALIYDYYNVVF